jgi:hypothetical protein
LLFDQIKTSGGTFSGRLFPGESEEIDMKILIPGTTPAQFTEITINANSDDGVLTEGLLRQDPGAWREFKRRFDDFLRLEVKKAIGWAMRRFLPSDAIDEVMGDFYLSIVEGNMHKLRTWAGSSRTARLPSWLRMIVYQIAIDHARAARRRGRLRGGLRADVRAGVSDENWGDAWIDMKEEVQRREHDEQREAERQTRREARRQSRKRRHNKPRNRK